MILTSGTVNSTQGQWSCWSGEQFSDEDLARYLSDADPLSRCFLEAMGPYTETVSCRGKKVQLDDWTGTNTFELDLLGRLQKMTDHKGNTVSYAYDAVGNQTGITYPDGSKTRSFYDAVYNLTSVIDAEKGTYAYVYDDANRPVKLTYPNGWIEQYTYDAEGNLLKTVIPGKLYITSKTLLIKV